MRLGIVSRCCKGTWILELGVVRGFVYEFLSSFFIVDICGLAFLFRCLFFVERGMRGGVCSTVVIIRFDGFYL